MDSSIYNYVSSLHSGTMNIIMSFISFLGSGPFIVILGLIMAWVLMRIKKHYWDSSFVLLNPLGSGALNKILKYIFQRQRPDLEHLAEVTGYSFPSGHSMVSFSFYGFMAYIIFLNIEKPRLRYPIMAIFILLAFCIGISRIYLGVHYASDVIGGFIGGGVWIVTCVVAHQAVRYYKSI